MLDFVYHEVSTRSCGVCKEQVRVSPKKGNEHVNHPGAERLPPTNSEGANEQFHDQLNWPWNLSTIQGQMDSLLHTLIEQEIHKRFPLPSEGQASHCLHVVGLDLHLSPLYELICILCV